MKKNLKNYVDDKKDLSHIYIDMMNFQNWPSRPRQAHTKKTGLKKKIKKIKLKIILFKKKIGWHKYPPQVLG
jgi:hypothetical protein